MRFCSYDARGVDVSNGVHMAVSDLERRCLFSLSPATGGNLKLFKITEADRGLYKCRVDFSNSPTQHSKMHLDLVGEFSKGRCAPATSRKPCKNVAFFASLRARVE